MSRAGHRPGPGRGEAVGGMGQLGREFREPRSWACQMGGGIGEVLQAEGVAPAEAWEGEHQGYFVPV